MWRALLIGLACVLIASIASVPSIASSAGEGTDVELVTLPDADAVWAATQLRHAVYRRYLTEVLGGIKAAQSSGGWRLRLILPASQGEKRALRSPFDSWTPDNGLSFTIYGQWLSDELRVRGFSFQENAVGHFVLDRFYGKDAQCRRPREDETAVDARDDRRSALGVNARAPSPQPVGSGPFVSLDVPNYRCTPIDDGRLSQSPYCFGSDCDKLARHIIEIAWSHTPTSRIHTLHLDYEQ